MEIATPCNHTARNDSSLFQATWKGSETVLGNAFGVVVGWQPNLRRCFIYFQAAWKIVTRRIITKKGNLNGFQVAFALIKPF